MAAKKYYANIEMNQNQIKNFVLETTTSTLANSGAISGRIIFDTEDEILKYYDGTNWQSVETRFDGQLIYKGAIPHDQAEASPKANGDLYVFTSAGTATNYGNLVVEIGDFAFYEGSSSSWKIIQGNTILATETNSGVVRLANEADDSEVTTEVDDVATTPADITTWADQTNKTVVRKRVYTSQTIDSDGLPLTHAIGKNNPRVTVYDSNMQQIALNVVHSGGTVTLYSNTEISGATVVIYA